MYRYKRLLVELTLSARDGTTLRYAGLISRMANSEKVYFVHVPETLEIPEELCCDYPELTEPLDEAEAHIMQEVVREHFEGPEGIEIDYQVHEGAELVEVLRWAHQKSIDLLVVGTERTAKDREPTAEKLARKAPCSVLVVPDGSKPRIQKILVPVDFSEHTEDALDVAIAFASAAGIPEIVCMHTYHVPPGFHKTGKTHEEFAKVMLGHAEKKFREISSNLDQRDIQLSPVYVLDKKPFVAIRDAIADLKPDLLVMGARGRSSVAAIFLGSVTEKVLHSVEIPIVAVKRKGAGMGILDVLLEI